jgi:hypothetical protein
MFGHNAKIQKKKTEQKYDMRKEYNVEDKMLMNSSRCKAVK